MKSFLFSVVVASATVCFGAEDPPAEPPISGLEDRPFKTVLVVARNDDGDVVKSHSARGRYLGRDRETDEEAPFGTRMVAVLISVKKGKNVELIRGWGYPQECPDVDPPRPCCPKPSCPTERTHCPTSCCEPAAVRAQVINVNIDVNTVVNNSITVEAPQGAPAYCTCGNGQQYPITRWYQYSYRNQNYYWYRCPTTNTVRWWGGTPYGWRY